jgi:hypothetical protein
MLTSSAALQFREKGQHVDETAKIHTAFRRKELSRKIIAAIDSCITSYWQELIKLAEWMERARSAPLFGLRYQGFKSEYIRYKYCNENSIMNSTI